MAEALSFFLILQLQACDRAPPEPTSSPPNPSVPRRAAADDPAADDARTAAGPRTTGAVCPQPLSPTPSPPVTSRDDCPSDPDGRPKMPWGRVRFIEAGQAPELRVERALTADHQRHGLMFRSQLSDNEGMLFSYEDEDVRTFWMHDTCLALDMIHIDGNQRIVGVVENVPPWNDAIRSVGCPAQHVLEVPAGWVRRYGVEPGQRVALETQP